MTDLLANLPVPDLVALGIFFAIWIGFELITNRTALRHSSLSGLMAHKRREWMLVLAEREIRMVDTAVMNGLQQGTAFFASACMLAIGGSFALLGSTDVALEIYSDLANNDAVVRRTFEIKVLGLALIFVYAFFKFGWAFRLFNYCSILVAAVDQPDTATFEERKEQALRAADMNIIASGHFTAGLRGIFMALGYLGWFIGPGVLVATTLFVLLVLIRRQYFSRARSVLLS